MKKIGAVYYAVKDNKFVRHVRHSIESLKKHMPDIAITIFTDLDFTGVEANIVKVDTPTNPLQGRVDCFLKAKEERCVFLDADTYIYSDFYEAFELLDRFDLAATLAPHYVTNEFYDEIPWCFPELNLGVVFWKNNNRTTDLFNKWKELFASNSGVKTSQPHFRTALYYSDVRFAVLPWEYNCRHNGPGYLFDEVKIFHRWNVRRLKREADIINSGVGKRVITGKKMFVVNHSKNISNTLEYRK